MKHGLPTMAEDGEIVREAGALLSYSVTRAEEDRRVASYIDRILRGAKVYANVITSMADVG
jgi:hypothetical protein